MREARGKISKATTILVLFVFSVLTFLGGYVEASVDYDFRVMREDVVLDIGKDGNSVLSYLIEFQNYGSGFNIVDVGLPNRHYEVQSAVATVYVSDDGDSYQSWNVKKIAKSEYIDTGAEVHVNAGSYRYVKLDFRIRQRWMVYENPADSSEVSVEFRPTWFDGDLQRGDTDRTSVTFVLPDTIKDLNRTYTDKGWDESWNEGSRYHVKWDFSSKSPGEISRGACDTNIAFSKDHVDHYYKKTIWSRTADWFYYNQPILFIVAGVIIISTIIAITFYFSGRKRRDYFRPSVSLTNAGPRGGLTAPEAAMVMELPLDKVVAMILFGMKIKGAIEIEGDEKPIFRKIDRSRLTYNYEKDVYDSIEDDGGVNQHDLGDAREEMIKETEKKMEGFSQRKTEQYYKLIIDEAWGRVKSCSNEHQLESVLKENGVWLQAVDDFDKRVETNIYPVYIPTRHQS